MIRQHTSSLLLSCGVLIAATHTVISPLSPLFFPPSLPPSLPRPRPWNQSFPWPKSKSALRAASVPTTSPRYVLPPFLPPSLPFHFPLLLSARKLTHLPSLPPSLPPLQETGLFLAHTTKRIGRSVVVAAATAGQHVHKGAKHVHGQVK